MSDSLQKEIRRFSDRQQIYDTINSFARGADRLDRELYESACHPDVVLDYGFFLGGRDEFYEWMQKMLIEQRHSTQHLLANHNVDIDGDIAHVETYFINSSVNKQGKPFGMTGGRYIDQLIRHNGGWAITKRVVLTDWQLPLAGDAFEQAVPRTSTACRPANRLSPVQKNSVVEIFRM
ncbi:nuclear transport factor 2 family protein [Mycobacterium sp. MS1601]|uniref:nuclear transport factor 2 family protein n=1 Tax=Mycobacterium sp. MS1601 TaxID=1936029 RepID=UPI0009F820F8|nr:nuclear transport factor 2 family protein [Mycobacterium sp. MS1601]